MYNFEDLKKANKTITPTEIKGRKYAEVNQRIKAFRSVCPCGLIETKMESNENGVCVFRAYIYDEDGKLLGTGTAFEKSDSTYINKTSYIENCETSAVGRALGMCGFGIDTSIASADEILTKKPPVEFQKVGDTPLIAPKLTPREQLVKILLEKEINIDVFSKEKGLNKNTSDEEIEKVVEELKKIK